MSFNTWARNKDLKAIAAEVRRQKPDIVGMMEFVPPKQKLLDDLKDELPHVGHCMDLPHCYLAFFSRWPIEKISGKSLWEGPPYLHAVVRTPQGRVHVFVVHTLRFPWLGSQMKQMRAMARLIRRVDGRKIVMGDFNSTPFSSMLLSFERSTRLPLRTYVPSWPAWAGPLPQLAIDHVLASPAFRTVSGPYIGDNAGSDHFPVILEYKTFSSPQNAITYNLRVFVHQLQTTLFYTSLRNSPYHGLQGWPGTCRPAIGTFDNGDWKVPLKVVQSGGHKGARESPSVSFRACGGHGHRPAARRSGARPCLAWSALRDGR